MHLAILGHSDIAVRLNGEFIVVTMAHHACTMCSIFTASDLFASRLC